MPAFSECRVQHGFSRAPLRFISVVCFAPCLPSKEYLLTCKHDADIFCCPTHCSWLTRKKRPHPLRIYKRRSHILRGSTLLRPHRVSLDPRNVGERVLLTDHLVILWTLRIFLLTKPTPGCTSSTVRSGALSADDAPSLIPFCRILFRSQSFTDIL